jgi:SAM-dependent methyltransferase
MAQSLWDIGAIVQLCGAAGSAVILDLGCGPGWTSWFLRKCGYRTVSADISHHMLLMARAHDGEAPPATPAVADSGRLPFRECSFDAVVLFDTLHHMPDVIAVFRECRRVLKPGGRIVIGEPGLIHYFSPSARAIARQTGVLEKGFARIQLQYLLSRAGFSAIRPAYFSAVTGTRGLLFVRMIAGYILEPLMPRRKIWVSATKPARAR